MATEIGTFVRRMRIEAMMTQQDVAKRSGISRSYLSRLESGDIARLGLQTGALGALFCALAVGLTPLRRAMNNHRKDLK